MSLDSSSSIVKVKSFNYIFDVDSSFSHGFGKFFWFRWTCKIIISCSVFLIVFHDPREAHNMNLTRDG